MSEQTPVQASPLVAPEDVEQHTSPVYFILQILFAVLFAVATAPYRRAFWLYTWQPLKEIRAANGDRNTLIPLVKDWKADKYNEVQSVQVAATFCGGACFSTLPWTRTANAIWMADALWFSSLIWAISAIITSIQLKSMLDDLPSRDELNSSLSETEVQRMRRTILRYKRTPGIKHWIMMFIWQFPSMTMAYAWVAFLCALTLYVCTPFIRGLPWQDQHKIAIVYLSVGFVGFVTYVFSTIFVYAGEKEFERSIASTRASTNTSTRANTVELEAGRIPDATDAQTGIKATQTSSSVQEINPVQIARSRGLIGSEQGERTRKDTEGSGRTRRILLY